MSGPQLVQQSEPRVRDKAVVILGKIALFSLQAIIYLLFVFPLKALAWVILRIKSIDPKISEKTKCPGCGWKRNRLNFKFTTGPEKAAIEHECLRCGALFYSQLLVKAEKWIAPTAQQDKVKQAAARSVL